jgi:hypothetical protein
MLLAGDGSKTTGDEGTLAQRRIGGVMTTARDIMHTGAECLGEHQSRQQAAQRMRDLDVGALPVGGMTTGCAGSPPTGIS